MTDTNAQEPTMEEILASIRRIISEDEAPAAAAPEPANETAELEAAEPEPERPAPAAAPTPRVVDEDDDILELTQPAPPLAQAAPSPQPAAARTSEEQLGDLEVFARPEPQSEPFAAAMTAASEPEDTLISPPAADLAASAFGQLSRTVAMPAEGRTLEDVVRELLRPMLKGWLDQHLPAIVEAAVRAEVERISRLRRL